MDLKTYFQITKPAERNALAARCQTSANYLYLAARGDRKVGANLAKKLTEEEPRLTLHELRPDIWSPEIAGSAPKPRESA